MGVYVQSPRDKKYKKIIEELGKDVEKMRKQGEMVMIEGDTNCHLGKKEGEEVLGDHAFGVRNGRGKMIIEMMKNRKKI